MVLISAERSVIALLLLVTLPVIVGARLCLDAHATLNTQPHVETEHNGCCAQAHDHRLCVLLVLTPWSPSMPCAVPTVSSPADSGPRDAEGNDCGRDLFQLEFARAPPYSA